METPKGRDDEMPPLPPDHDPEVAAIPSWARQVAVTIHRSGGAIFFLNLSSRGLSRRRIKKMLHGPHPILKQDGLFVRLTPLGERVVKTQAREAQGQAKEPGTSVTLKPLSSLFSQASPALPGSPPDPSCLVNSQPSWSAVCL